jgi:hypothetical protein
MAADAYDDFYADHIQDSTDDLSKKVFLNFSITNEAIESAYDDLKRLNEYHLLPYNTNPDQHKYAAFVAHWIARSRPINLSYNYDIPLLGILNAIYATYVFLKFIFTGKRKLSFKARAALVYQFHFRNPPGEQLAILAYFVEHSTLNDQDSELLENMHVV